MNIIETVRKDAWFIILIAIAISFVYPPIGFVLKPALPWLLMALMFFSSLGIDLKQVVKQLKNFSHILRVLLIIHIASPILVLFVRPLLSDELFLGLILASVTSSGLSVVFLSQLYGGKPADALAITSLSNILSPITIPFLVFVFAQTSITVDPIAMAFTIFKFVILPLVAAKLIQLTPLYTPIKKIKTPLSLGVLFFLIIAIISPVQQILLEDINRSLMLAGIVIGLSIITFILGWILSKQKTRKITYAICTSYKNFTLATVVALSLYSPLIALPAAMYTLINNVLLIPLQLLLLKKK